MASETINKEPGSSDALKADLHWVEKFTAIYKKCRTTNSRDAFYYSRLDIFLPSSDPAIYIFIYKGSIKLNFSFIVHIPKFIKMCENNCSIQVLYQIN